MDIVLLIFVVMLVALVILGISRVAHYATNPEAKAAAAARQAAAKAALAQRQALMDTLRQRLGELGWSSQQIEQSKVDSFALAEVLDDESIEAADPGFLDKAKGLLIATSRRLMFVNGTVATKRVEGFTYDSVGSVQYQSGPVATQLTLLVVNRHLTITGIPNALSTHLISYIRQRIEQRTPAPSSSSPLADLERLADLHARKVLTDEEFQAQKQKLLSQ